MDRSLLELDPTLVFVRDLDVNSLDVISGYIALFLAIVFQVLYNMKSLLFGANLYNFPERVVRSSPSSFEGIEGYYFKENYIITPQHLRLHYVDEGTSNKVVLCIHGVPLWSHSFRKIIPGLVSAGYRVIAPDLIGFGKSDKLTDFQSYSVELHLESLWDLIEKTTGPGDEIYIVGHNWGSLLGTIMVTQRPHLFSKLTLLNTNNLPDGELDLKTRFMGNVPQFFKYLVIDAYFLLFRTYCLLLGHTIPLHVLFFSLNTKYTKEDYKGFTAPFQEKDERAGVVAFPSLVPVAPNDRYSKLFKEVRNFLKYKWRKPTQIIYSERSRVPILQRGDFVVGNRRDFFIELLPHAQIASPPLRGGHIIMYDNPKGVLRNLIPFLNQT